MANPEQKKLWQAEKAQMLSDKKNQPREIRKRAVPLSFGGTKQTPKRDISPDLPSDDFLRKRLGL